MAASILLTAGQVTLIMSHFFGSGDCLLVALLETSSAHWSPDDIHNVKM
jgi:hypothetical protein